VTLGEKGNFGVRFYEGLNHLFVFGMRVSTPLEYSVQGMLMGGLWFRLQIGYWMRVVVRSGYSVVHMYIA
jgi:hypothetical protein